MSNLNNNVVEPFLITKSIPLNSKFQSFSAWSIESEFAFKFASTSDLTIDVFPLDALTTNLFVLTSKFSGRGYGQLHQDYPTAAVFPFVALTLNLLH